MRTFRHGRMKVTETPELVCAIPQDISSVMVRNTGTVTIYLGGQDVTKADGFPLQGDDGPMNIPSFEYDYANLYAVVPEGKTGSLAFLVSS